MDLSYQSIRSANQAREADEERTLSRKRNLLVLILHYLNDEGYLDSAHSLEAEASISLCRFDVCDNIDLETVLQEYESYYYVKFQKYPKIVKKLTESAPEAGGAGKGGGGVGGGKGGVGGGGKRGAANSTSTTSTLPRIGASVGASVGGVSGAGASSSQTRPNSGPANFKKNSISSSSSSSGVGSGRSGSNEYVNGKHAAVTSLLNGHHNNNNNNGSNNSNNNSNNNNNNNSHHSNGAGENGAVGAHALAGLMIQPCKSSADFAGGGGGGGAGGGGGGEGGKRHRAGTIIDVRGMINDATRLNVEDGSFEERLIKPLGGYLGVNQEMRDLATAISRDIYLHNPNVRWDDIIGLDEAKRLVKEAVVYPIKYPQLFTGILSPWKGLLLYGPPGTGKTLLAKAVATECQTTFFNISASSIVSKWRGDSEKLVRVLFEMARYHAPSTIFLDELESVMGQRGSSGGVGEHEGSRRMKTELLVQMDGLSRSEDLVFVLAASNLPWELDHAMLRRLEKRILVNLPTAEARKAMFQHHLPPVVCGRDQNGLSLESQLDYPKLAESTEGYSGADIKLVCKEAAMGAVRKVFDILENADKSDHLATIRLDTIETPDVLKALSRTKPSARLLQGKFEAWQKEYESV